MSYNMFSNDVQRQDLEYIINLMLGIEKARKDDEQEKKKQEEDLTQQNDVDLSDFRIMSDEDSLDETAPEPSGLNITSSSEPTLVSMDWSKPLWLKETPDSDLVLRSEEKVNHPNHYNDTPVETIEMFYLAFHDRPEMIKGALLFNVMKYRDRYRLKNGEEDLKKMNWYLEQLQTHFEEDMSVYDRYHNLKQDN